MVSKKQISAELRAEMPLVFRLEEKRISLPVVHSRDGNPISGNMIQQAINGHRNQIFLAAPGKELFAFTIGDKGYVGLGYNTVDGEHKDFWEYDPATDAWTRKADFAGKAREGAVAFSVANKGYVGLGANLRLPEYDYKDMWKYDPSTNQWTPSISFPGSASFIQHPALRRTQSVM